MSTISRGHGFIEVRYCCVEGDVLGCLINKRFLLMNGYHIFSLKNESAMYKRLADFFFRMTFSHVHYQNLKKKFLRPDYLQIQFVKKTFTLLFNTEIIYRPNLNQICLLVFYHPHKVFLREFWQHPESKSPFSEVRLSTHSGLWRKFIQKVTKQIYCRKKFTLLSKRYRFFPTV